MKDYEKIILLIIGYLLLLHLVSAQDEQTYGKLIKIDDVYYIEADSIKYLANPSVVTVRFKKGIERTNIVLDTIRANKLGFIDITVPNDTDLKEFVSMLKSTNDFEYINYNYFGELCYTSYDPLSNNQWYLSYIRAFEAWDITTGSSSVKVAVLDNYIQHNHQDLGWSSGACLPGPMYTHIDETLGRDFCPPEWLINDESHGTKVAGIIGAKTNNGIGVAGISGGNACFPGGITIIPIRVSNDISVKSDVVDDAIIYAVDKGAKIINMSFMLAWMPLDLEEAIEYALQKNVVLVASSGNNMVLDPKYFFVHYPARHPNVIAVGAVQQDTLRWNHSCYGAGLNVVAPGVDIWTTTPHNGYDVYGSATGTSFAAPQVSGIAALMLSVNPKLTWWQIRDIIQRTAKKIRKQNYFPSYTICSDQVGYGLVDAYAAVQEALETTCYNGLPIFTPTFGYSQIPTYVNNNITVLSGECLYIGNHVQFLENTGITVHPGAKLIIDGGTLTNACPGKLWQGITIKNAAQNQGGEVQILNNGKIENARCGICAFSNAIVSATDAYFITILME